MTAKAAFTAEEWTELRAVPAILSAAVSSADPSGLFGALKEAAGGTRGMIESLKEGGFMGFGGERVSAAEQGFLDELQAALAA